MVRLTLSIWSLGVIFIVLDVTILAKPFAQIINMRETGPWETDWIVISSQEATDKASLFVYFQVCFENIHTIRSRDNV